VAGVDDDFGADLHHRRARDGSDGSVDSDGERRRGRSRTTEPRSTRATRA